MTKRPAREGHLHTLTANTEIKHDAMEFVLRGGIVVSKNRSGTGAGYGEVSAR